MKSNIYSITVHHNNTDLILFRLLFLTKLIVSQVKMKQILDNFDSLSLSL